MKLSDYPIHASTDTRALSILNQDVTKIIIYRFREYNQATGITFVEKGHPNYVIMRPKKMVYGLTPLTMTDYKMYLLASLQFYAQNFDLEFAHQLVHQILTYQGFSLYETKS